jgi:pantetheine-phosphate adenylyltransferase
MTARAPHALFPGSFDPATLGHLDLVKRAHALFGRVTIGVAHNLDKKGLFTTEERIEMLRRAVHGQDGVEVRILRGLVVTACEELGATVIVRGTRNGTDFDFEVAMARTNRAMLPRIETVLLAPAPEFAHVSSSLVRQIALAGGDASQFVPPAVAEALRARAARNPKA